MVERFGDGERRKVEEGMEGSLGLLSRLCAVLERY
jgi:hypothetical protein